MSGITWLHMLTAVDGQKPLCHLYVRSHRLCNVSSKIHEQRPVSPGLRIGLRKGVLLMQVDASSNPG